MEKKAASGPPSTEAAPWASTIIITRDRARWLGAVLDFYVCNRLAPTILLNACSTDGTGASLQSRGWPYTLVNSKAPRVEVLVASIAQAVPKGWALRMDDDEVPSHDRIAFFRGPSPSFDVSAVALPRWRLSP